MKKKELFLMLIVVILLTITVTLIAYSQYKVLDKVTLEADITVIPKSEKLGFNVDTDGLRYGNAIQKSVASRNITITNIWEEDALIQIFSYGDIKEWIRPAKNNFLLPAGESTEVSVNLKVPEDAELGYQEGRVSIVFLRV